MKRRSRILEVLALAVLLPTSAASAPTVSPLRPPAGMAPSVPSRPPYLIRGLLTLITANLSQSGSVCAGQGGYADIQAGKPITITDAAGKVIGVGHLGAGQRVVRSSSAGEGAHGGACDFEFAVGGVPEVSVYEVRLEERGTLQYSLAEMKLQDWFIRLQLRAE